MFILFLLNRYISLDTGCATLRTLPFDRLKWGSVSGGRGVKADHLYLGPNLFTLWIVGEVTGRVFMDRGHNTRKPSIKVRPLLSGDLHNAYRLINGWARPAQRTFA